MTDADRYWCAGLMALSVIVLIGSQVLVSSIRPHVYLWIMAKHRWLFYAGHFLLTMSIVLAMKFTADPSNPWWMGILVSIVASMIAWYFNRSMIFRASSIMTAAFEKRFPGRCVICAWSAWGVEEGFASWDQIPKHEHQRRASCRE